MVGLLPVAEGSAVCDGEGVPDCVELGVTGAELDVEVATA